MQTLNPQEYLNPAEKYAQAGTMAQERGAFGIAHNYFRCSADLLGSAVKAASGPEADRIATRLSAVEELQAKAGKIAMRKSQLS